MNENNSMSTLARNNKVCMIAHIATDSVMLLLLILQAATRGISPVVLLISCILGTVPVAAEIFCWRKNPETTAIRHLVGNGYAIFFTFYIYTSVTFWAPSVRKVPQAGSCISIKVVSLKRCNPCGYAVFSLLRSARWCRKASSISSGVSSWRIPTPL